MTEILKSDVVQTGLEGFKGQTLINYIEAVEESPDGVLCGECGKPNYWFDDYGFFYANNTEDIYVPVCMECHFLLYGRYSGDR